MIRTNRWLLFRFQAKAILLQSIECLYGMAIESRAPKLVFEHFKLMFKQMPGASFKKLHKGNIFIIFKEYFFALVSFYLFI